MSLVSDPALKHKLKFQNMPMQELRVLLENNLHQQGYNTFLTNVTENDLALNITKPSSKATILSISRQRHKPLEVEVTVDHKLLDSHSLITKKAKSENTGGRQNPRMMYRWLWIGMILFSVIITSLVLFVNIIVSIIESATPGWTSNQRSLGILLVAVLVILWYVYVRPKFQRMETHRRIQADSVLLENVKEFIKSIAYQATANSIVRCWNCFEEIVQSENFCSSCGKQQN